VLYFCTAGNNYNVESGRSTTYYQQWRPAKDGNGVATHSYADDGIDAQGPTLRNRALPKWVIRGLNEHEFITRERSFAVRPGPGDP
jgi:hypothetical protein